MRALWVHAIVPTSDVLGFEAPGDAGGTVYTVPFQQLAAVVQPANGVHVQAMDGAARQAHEAAHAVILEIMAEAYPILPVAFGTVLADEEEVQRLLRFGKNAFEQLLADLVGLVQVEVAIRREASEPDEPRARAAEIVRQMRDVLDEQQAVLIRALETTLHTLALATRPLPEDEGVLLRQALLLGADGRQQLEALLVRIEPYLDPRLRIDCSAPAPPARFAAVGIETKSPAELAEARRALAVSPDAMPAALHRAYERQVNELLSDAARDAAPNAEARHAKLAASMQLLVAAAAQQPPADASVLLFELPTLDIPHTFPVSPLS